MKEVVALSLALTLVLSAPAHAAGCDDLDGTSGIVCRVNAERAAHDLQPLRAAPALNRAAREHAQDMVARGFFAHITPEGEGVSDRARAAGYLRGRARWWVGECLAWGTGTRGTPDGIVQAWMDSPPHRRLVLSARARQLGIGLADGAPQPAAADGVTVALELGGR
jgi:uncharacterized protein YkwD